MTRFNSIESTVHYTQQAFCSEKILLILLKRFSLKEYTKLTFEDYYLI
jgi:hypothetical protein